MHASAAVVSNGEIDRHAVRRSDESGRELADESDARRLKRKEASGF